MSQPKVSVIIPAFNLEGYIDKCLESVCSQTIDKEDMEMLEDMIVIAINNAMMEIDKATENKMGKYTKGMPGIF